MSRIQGPGLLFQNQNLIIHDEESTVKRTNNGISKASQKKVGGNRKALQDLSNSGLVNQTQKLDISKEGPGMKKTSDAGSRTSLKKVGGTRKALQDLSNSLSVRKDAAREKKNLSREVSSVAEERCSHNSTQCTAARKVAKDQYVNDAILFEHGLLHPDTSPLPKETEASSASPPKYFELEPIPELPLSAETDWFPSPIHLDSPRSSASLYELPELKKSLPRAREAELTFGIQGSVLHQGPALKKTVDRKSIASQKKVAEGVIGTRKALQDITNSSSFSQNAATKDKHSEEIHNIVEEGFLHDHNKCIAAQKTQMERDIHYSFLFEHGLLNSDASPEMKTTTTLARDSPPRYLELEEIDELPMPTIAEWCPSPIQLDSPPFSPSRYELPGLSLKAGYED